MPNTRFPLPSVSLGTVDLVAGARHSLYTDAEAPAAPMEQAPSAEKAAEARCWADVASMRQPVFVQNPDGRLGCAVPPGSEALLLPAPMSPRLQRIEVREDGRAATLELAEVLRCHQSGFLVCMLFQLSLEVALASAYLRHAEPAVQRVAAGYPQVQGPLLWRLFWGMALCDLAYLAVYYGLGLSLFVHSSEVKYQRFAQVALLGVVVQVLVVYMSRLNILAFFCRLVCYAYARILRKLQGSLDLRLAGLPLPSRTFQPFAI